MNVRTPMTSCGAVLMVSFAGAGLCAISVVPASAGSRFQQTNLVSDIPGFAKITDPSLVNAWGISESSTSPFWISDNGKGLSTLYSVPGSGPPPVTTIPLTVTIPRATGASMSSPTGQVFNSVGGFNLSNGMPATFLFDSEDGAISGWNPALGTPPGVATGLVAVNNGNADPSLNAVYKGLAISNFSNPSDPTSVGTLYATNFRSGFVEMYDSNFNPAGTITDTSLTSNGYAPFNDEVIGGELYVTFAKQDAAKHDDQACAGCGFVDIFNLDGSFDKRLISGGALNSPWGLAEAPPSWGSLAGDLLVGNFGDGRINVYKNGNWVSALDGTDGSPLSIDGLWGLTFGNGIAGGDLNTLYFTAGPNGEANGLFGALTAVPEPSTWAMLLLGLGGLGFAAIRRDKTSLVAA